MSACHTHTSGHQHHHAGERVDPSAPGVDPGIRGGGGLRLFHLPWLGAEYERKVCEWLVNNEASFGASRHPGLLLSGVPSANVNNKRQSGIIRPPDAWGVFLFNHVCVMNAAAVNHCLFIMSPKCSCNVVLMLLLPCQTWCVCPRVRNWRNWDGVCFYYSRTVALVLVGYCDNVMTRPQVMLDWLSPWDFHIMLSWVWEMKIHSWASFDGKMLE